MDKKKYTKRKRKTVIKLGAMVVLSGLLLTLSGCTTFDNFVEAFFGKESGDTIKVAVYQPYTGEDKEEGLKEIRGIEIGNQLFPEALGKEVELVEVDTGSNINIARTSLEEVVPEAPAAVLGSYGSAFSLLGSEYFSNAQIPAITITNNNAYVTSDDNYYYRVSAVETRQAEAVTDFVINDLKKTKVAVMYSENDDVGNVLATDFEARMQEATNSKAEIQNIKYLETEANYNKYFQAIEDYGIDTVYLKADPESAATIIKEADNRGYMFNFVGDSSWDTGLAKELKGTSVGVYYPNIVPSINTQSPYYQDFVDAYKAAYPEVETIPIESYMAFDAYVLLIDSMERAGDYINGKKLAEAIAATENFSGVSGEYSFDSNGDALVNIKIMKIENGQSKLVYLSKPSNLIIAPSTEDESEDESEEESEISEGENNEDTSTDEENVDEEGNN